ncbi:hypothetical protein B0T26DRAFT_651675 [Lasiosphaeria miniovina]|uniref:Gag protein n=1 Tax=Lasiosphaeria miniovina TaxID=1954250 RepID=A0AA40ACQ7_9PEZI|nr:uncharacterized protein B0T26DRAFT_651675 [Lasiosphaeria miniovina]KAK0713453.1 hypothetical protein B0T26DRAFT_651675 [Lasiosphaeria miniovina]
MNTNDKAISLTSSDDWESWNLQFQAQAIAGGIWNEIQGVTPFLDEPTAPNPTHYKHKAPSQSTITARGSTASMAGDDELGPTNQQPSQPITTADLTADGLRTHQMDWTVYQANDKKYMQQFERVERLKQWILKTTSPHLQLTSCDPTKPIPHWYTALKTQVGISDDEALYNAREAYRVATKPLLRAPKDLIKWSESWEQAIAMAQRKGVPEALSTKTWLFDFLDAVKPTLGHWVTSYKLAKSAELTLNYRAVANDFRKEVRQSTKARIPVGSRIAKGSVGPSFVAKEGKSVKETDAYPEDALDSEVEPGSDGGEQNNGRKRQRGKPKNGPKKAPGIATICPCCGQFHHLEKCWYTFPEKAPDGFVEREHLRMRVKEALLSPDLQKEVERLKTKSS